MEETRFILCAREWLNVINPLVREAALDLEELEARIDRLFKGETPETLDLYKTHLNIPALLFAFYSVKFRGGSVDRSFCLNEPCTSVDILRYIVLLRENV